MTIGFASMCTDCACSLVHGSRVATWFHSRYSFHRASRRSIEQCGWLLSFLKVRPSVLTGTVSSLGSAFLRCIKYLSESSKAIKSREPSRWQWNDSEKSLAIFKDRIFAGSLEKATTATTPSCLWRKRKRRGKSQSFIHKIRINEPTLYITRPYTRLSKIDRYFNFTHKSIILDIYFR